MPSDEHSSRRRRRSRDDDGVDEYGRDKRSKPSRHDRDSKDPEKDGDRSREKRRHRRSRSPRDQRDPPSRSRDRDRDYNHDEDRDRDREHRRRRSRDAERRDRGSHRARARGGEENEELDDKYDDSRARKRSSKTVAAAIKRDGPLPSQDDSFALTTGEEPPKPKEKPNFGNTGALAAASNAVVQSDGTKLVLKYHEPPEARKPPARDEWKLFVFKGSDVLDTVPLSGRSCWLVGRETAVVDLVAEHPSISKQHAVIQFRHLERRNEYGDKIGRVRPYLIDLESANGTALNGKRIPDSRYLELKDKDLIQFGQSSREYVLMLAPRD
ncbi:hypothetical protein SLS62_004608 [Diatrype stigma]|uniref:FHA domain-containing protein n=1 Tax=Diatrype stigma TaxID=117547 RepID=A0AAN9YP17_9PEZI